MRESKKHKNIFRLPGVIVPSAVVTPRGDIVIPAPAVT